MKIFWMTECATTDHYVLIISQTTVLGTKRFLYINIVDCWNTALCLMWSI